MYLWQTNYFVCFGLEAKKHLAEIQEQPSPSNALVEVEDCGTQMSAEKVKEPPTRKKSRRHALYKEPLQISEPLDCGQFIVSIAITKCTEDHEYLELNRNTYNVYFFIS